MDLLPDQGGAARPNPSPSFLKAANVSSEEIILFGHLIVLGNYESLQGMYGITRTGYQQGEMTAEKESELLLLLKMMDDTVPPPRTAKVNVKSSRYGHCHHSLVTTKQVGGNHSAARFKAQNNMIILIRLYNNIKTNFRRNTTISVATT